MPKLVFVLTEPNQHGDTTFPIEDASEIVFRGQHINLELGVATPFERAFPLDQVRGLGLVGVPSELAEPAVPEATEAYIATEDLVVGPEIRTVQVLKHRPVKQKARV